MNVRAGTPKVAIDKLYASASRALKQPDIKAQLGKLSLDIVDLAPEAAAKNLAEQAKMFAEVAKRIGMRPE